MQADCRQPRAQTTVVYSFLLQKFKTEKFWKSSLLPGASDMRRTSFQNLLDPAPWMPLNHQSHSRLCHGSSPKRKEHILTRQRKYLARTIQSHLDKSFSFLLTGHIAIYCCCHFRGHTLFQESEEKKQCFILGFWFVFVVCLRCLFLKYYFVVFIIARL